MLWQLEVPLKVKKFLQRACRNVLPTRKRLQDKSVQCLPSCVRCHAKSESIFHLLFTCAFNRECWEKEGLCTSIARCMARQSSFKDLFFELCDCFSMPQILNMLMVMWSLWMSLNNLIWENKEEVASVVVARAKHIWDEWKMAKHYSDSTQATVQQQQESKWSKPSANFLTCNVDASLSNHTFATVVGMCFREEASDFLMAKTDWQEHRMEVKEGEAWGFPLALQWASEMELSHVNFQVDSQVVVDSVKSDTVNVSEFGCLISHCGNSLCMHPNFRVEFIRRPYSCREAIFWARRYVFDSVPICIGDIIDLEMQ